MRKINLSLLFLIAQICILISLKSFAEENKIQNELVVIGPDSAVVKIKIFSSLTCPHCANFHNNELRIKKLCIYIINEFSKYSGFYNSNYSSI